MLRGMNLDQSQQTSMILLTHYYPGWQGKQPIPRRDLHPLASAPSRGHRKKARPGKARLFAVEIFVYMQKRPVFVDLALPILTVLALSRTVQVSWHLTE